MLRWGSSPTAVSMGESRPPVAEHRLPDVGDPATGASGLHGPFGEGVEDHPLRRRVKPRSAPWLSVAVSMTSAVAPVRVVGHRARTLASQHVPLDVDARTRSRSAHLRLTVTDRGPGERTVEICRPLGHILGVEPGCSAQSGVRRLRGGLGAAVR